MRFPLPLLNISLAVAFSCHSTALAQKPLPQRPKPINSAEIAPDNHVTFRIKAAEAKSVAIRGQWTKDSIPLTKDDEGIWSVTTSEPVTPGIWEYSFVIDGVTMIDPANPALKPQRRPTASILQIRGTPPNIWDFQENIPHGTVHQHSYQSKPLGRLRECALYTPPGYETDSTKTYPLLVLQHGSGDNQQTWITHGKAHWILDNLISQQKARPMVVLMIDGHPLGDFPREQGADRTAALKAFESELFQDALPLAEKLYRIDKDASHRAIAGLSMGGWHALGVGLGNLDRFSVIGSFSGLPPEDIYTSPAFTNPETTNQRLKLLWIACGKDDFLRERNELFITRLNEAKINHEWHLTEGAHSWPIWRNYLADFLPKLFPESAK